MRKLLIVDDQPLVVFMLEQVLKTRYEVIIARSYTEAVRTWREHEIEILITDVNLNDFKSGIDFVAELKENRPSLIAFICSGEWANGKKVRTRFRDDELVRFLEKPVDIGKDRAIHRDSFKKETRKKYVKSELMKKTFVQRSRYRLQGTSLLVHQGFCRLVI